MNWSIVYKFKDPADRSICSGTTALLASMCSLFQRSLWRSLSSNHTRAYHAAVLSSHVSTSSPEFMTKAAAMDELVRDLEAKMATARQGGGSKSAERMRAKGKKLPRERFGNSPSNVT